MKQESTCPTFSEAAFWGRKQDLRITTRTKEKF